MNRSYEATSDYGPSSPSKEPTTPPLVFTTQFANAQSLPDYNGNSPFVEPLQVINYSSVVGGGGGGGSASTTVSRRTSWAGGTVPISPITVICRTKGSGQSPYLSAVQNGEALLELDGESLPGGMKNPYGYTRSGRSTPINVSSPTLPATSGNCFGASSDPYDPLQHQRQQQKQQHVEPNDSAHRRVSTLDPNYVLPPEVVHRALLGRCRFIPFAVDCPSSNSPSIPVGAAGMSKGSTSNFSSAGSGMLFQQQQQQTSSAAADGESSAEGFTVFIGQVRFETSAAELMWLVRRTCGAIPSHLESRGAGCYLLHCKSEADLTLVRGLHKRILFDIGGAWIARTAEEIDSLCEYVALDAPLLSRKARLPRDSMVVEDLKVECGSSSSGAANGGGAGGSRHSGSGGVKHHHGGGGPRAHYPSHPHQMQIPQYVMPPQLGGVPPQPPGYMQPIIMHSEPNMYGAVSGFLPPPPYS